MHIEKSGQQQTAAALIDRFPGLRGQLLPDISDSLSLNQHIVPGTHLIIAVNQCDITK